MNRKVYDAIYYKRRKLSDSCVRCRGPRDSRKKHCKACLEYFRTRLQQLPPESPEKKSARLEKQRVRSREYEARKRTKRRLHALDKLAVAS